MRSSSLPLRKRWVPTIYIRCVNKWQNIREPKNSLAELAEEEEKHRELLEHVSVGKVFQGKLDPIPDLRISDYLIDVQCQPDSSYADILRLVMKNEEHSVKLYNDLKESCMDEDLKRLFEFLAHEEAKHKLKFEKIYDEEILK